MTAATLTPAAAADDLLDRLRQLVAAYGDGSASSVEEVRRLCKELTALVGKTRRRVTKFEQQAIEEPAPEPTARVAPAGQPAPQRADVRIPDEPKPQQQEPPKPPPEAPETPPLPPKGPRSWGAWFNAWLLAVVSTVIALIIAVRAVGSLVVRAARWAGRRVTRPLRSAWRTVRRSP